MISELANIVLKSTNEFVFGSQNIKRAGVSRARAIKIEILSPRRFIVVRLSAAETVGVVRGDGEQRVSVRRAVIRSGGGGY